MRPMTGASVGGVRSLGILILVLQMSACASLGSRLLDRVPGQRGAHRGAEVTTSSYQHGPGLGIMETGNHDMRVGLGHEVRSRLENSFFSRFFLDSPDRFGVSTTLGVTGCTPFLRGLNERGPPGDLVTGLDFRPGEWDPYLGAVGHFARPTRLSYRLTSDVYVGFSFSPRLRSAGTPSGFSLFHVRRTMCLASR